MSEKKTGIGSFIEEPEKITLFEGMDRADIDHVLSCLGAYEKKYKKGQCIYREGQRVSALGIVLSGSVLIERNDVWGNRSVLGCAERGHIFAESYACIPDEPMLVRVTASEPSVILFLEIRKLTQMCESNCAYHSRLIRNLLTVTAGKNVELSRKVFHTSPKSVRGRLLSYLSYCCALYGEPEFLIPFKRQELADYLGVDRSALSTEIAKMHREGLIWVYRNFFRVYTTEDID